MTESLKADSYDAWLSTEKGKFIFSRQKKLILDLLSPMAGESVLSVGCRGGHYLNIFDEMKCLLTGTDGSTALLNKARSILPNRTELIESDPETLPFSDNEFDIVVLIHTLSTCTDPEKTLAEAIRVCRCRLFIGSLNPYPLTCTRHWKRQIADLPHTLPLQWHSRSKLESMVRRTMGAVSISWGSTVFLPDFVYSLFSELEEVIPQKNNPIGAFLGLAFPVRYTYRTVEQPILNTFGVKPKTATVTAPDVARDALRETRR